MRDFPIPDSPNKNVVRSRGIRKSRILTNSAFGCGNAYVEAEFSHLLKMESLYQAVGNLVDAHERKHDGKRDADSLEVLEEERRHIRQVREDRSDSKDVLLAVQFCKEVAECYREIAEADICRQTDGNDEVDAALQEDCSTKDGHELVEEVSPAVLPQDFPVDDSAFLDPATQHCLKEIQSVVVRYSLPDQVHHLQKHKHADDKGHPHNLRKMTLKDLLFNEDREDDVSDKNADDLWNGTDDIQEKREEEV